MTIFAESLLLLAVLSITAPLPEDEDYPLKSPILMDVIKAVGIEWELVDPDKDYLFYGIENFDADLNAIRIRYEDLLEAPPLSDHRRWPSYEFAKARVEFNREYFKFVESRILVVVDPTGWEKVRQDTDKKFWPWRYMQNAADKSINIVDRRYALLALKTDIGDWAYYATEIPDHVPVWAFYPIR